jgi:hypothetical protein
MDLEQYLEHLETTDPQLFREIEADQKSGIHALIADYVAAKSRQEQLRDAPNQAFILSEYYAASDATSRVVFRMINHPDWTYELQEEYYPRFFEIPYPVSC